MAPEALANAIGWSIAAVFFYLYWHERVRSALYQQRFLAIRDALEELATNVGACWSCLQITDHSSDEHAEWWLQHKHEFTVVHPDGSVSRPTPPDTDEAARR